MVRRGRDFAHRLREPLEPASGSRRRARQGVCRPWRTRSEPRRDRSPVAHGEPVLSGAGAALGLGLALALIAWLAHQGSLALPLLSTLRIDAQALGWTVLVAVLTAMVFGLLPALRIASGNLQAVLKDSGAGAGLGRKHEHVRAVLVVSEIALACVLLVSAGLLLRSFLKVLDVDLGFQPERAASIKVEYDDSAPSEEASQSKRGEIFQQIIARVSALPGRRGRRHLRLSSTGTEPRVGTRPCPRERPLLPGELPEPLVYVITPGFIRAMGIRMHGRDFTWADGPHSERVVLINASAARLYWPGEDAVGKILMRDKEEDRVVGVVDDVHEETWKAGRARKFTIRQCSKSRRARNWWCAPACRPRRWPRAFCALCAN